MVGTSGAAATRFTPVTPSARKRPACTNGMIPSMLLNSSVTSPPSTAVAAGAEPLYGTCVMRTPAIRLKSSPASLPHLAGELFNLMAGVRMTHVPYKGSAPAAIAVLGGEVTLLFSNMLGIMPFVQAGRFRALGVTGVKRVAAAPEVPTIAEAGLPGYEVIGWYGLIAPAGTPKQITPRLSAQPAVAMRAPEVAKRFSSEGAEPVGSTPEAFAETISRDIVKWAKVIKASGARVD